MGSVRDLYTTGDNDPEIHPERYYRHYLYCDACGSFELETWERPESPEALAAKRRRLGRAALLAGALALASGGLALVGGLSLALVVAFVLAVALAGGLLAWRAVLGATVEHLGMRCRRCRTTYGYGTPFFTDLEANPRKLTVADVPRPLGTSPFEIGAPVEAEPDPPPSRLPA